MDKLIKEEKQEVSRPFPTRKIIGQEEKAAVMVLFDRCIENGGAFDRYDDGIVDEYEKQFAAYHGLKYGSAVSSGTGAVHTALGALRLEPFTEVISAPITDPGAVAPILWMNCIPVFADVEPGTYNMSAKGVEARITDKTSAIIVGHIGGDPADIEGIMKVAKKRRIPVIEDCSQSHGASIKGKKIGTFGDLGVWSLMSGKHHTAGGQGGMVLTNNEDLYWNAKRFADRGKPFNSAEGSNLFLGINYRMTSLEATVGMVQLAKLAGFVENRRKVAERVREGIKDLKTISFAKEVPGALSSRWFLIFRLDESRMNGVMQDVLDALKAEQVPGGIKYNNLIYEQKWIKERIAYGSTQLPWSAPQYGREISYEGSCPEARKAIDTHFVVIPSEDWGVEESDRLVKILRGIESRFKR